MLQESCIANLFFFPPSVPFSFISFPLLLSLLLLLLLWKFQSLNLVIVCYHFKVPFLILPWQALELAPAMHLIVTLTLTLLVGDSTPESYVHWVETRGREKKYCTYLGSSYKNFHFETQQYRICNSQYLLTAHYMLGIVLNAFHELSSLIPTAMLQNNY